MANIVSSNAAKKQTEVTPLFNGASKKAQAKGVKYTITNKNFFTDHHEYFGICSKEYFLKYYKALTNEQHMELWLLIDHLTNNKKLLISEVRFDENKISYVEVTTTFERKKVTFKMFYFHGLFKLLNFHTFCTYKLSLKELLKIARTK